MKFETATPIGRGGMGEVAKAWDPTLNRYVALKFLTSTNPEARERMLREARAQARIDHPNICKVFDVGTQDGRPYIAMQFIDGKNLGEAAATMDLETKVVVIKAVAEAIQAAHAAGLIHRDLKPANILIESDESGQPRPYVVDFGIARELEVAGATMTGQVIGTPGYLSPEQARGETTTLDRRSDVFSLGVILYELCAGRGPFEDPSIAGTLIKVLQEDPPPLRSVATEVPRDLEAIVDRCLDKDPRRRYPSARALSEDLGRFLDGLPVEARPIGVSERLWRRARKRPVVTLLAVGLMVLPLLIGGVVWRERRSASERARLAEVFGQEVERIESLLRRAYTLPLHDVRPERKLVEKRLDALQRQMDELGGEAYGPGRYALGKGWLALGRIEPARSNLEAAWAVGYRTPEVAYALGRALGELYRRKLDALAELPEGESRARRRAALDRQLGGPMLHYLEEARGAEEEAPELVLGWRAYYEERWEEAARRARQALDGRPWLYEGEKLLGDALVRRGREQVLSGHFSAASLSYREGGKAYAKALDIARSDPSLYIGECRRRLLAIQLENYHDDQREIPWDEALSSCRDGLVADPEEPALWRGLANIYWRRAEIEQILGRDPGTTLDEAVMAGERAAALDPRDVSVFSDLATAYLIRAEEESKRGLDPRSSLDRAEATARRVVEAHPMDDYANGSLADVYYQRALFDWSCGENARPNFDAALASLARALEIRPIYAWWGNLAEVQLRRGLYEEERGGDPTPYFEAAIENGERAVNANPEVPGFLRYVALAWKGLAERRLKQGGDVSAELARGIDAVERARAVDPNDPDLIDLDAVLHSFSSRRPILATRAGQH